MQQKEIQSYLFTRENIANDMGGIFITKNISTILLLPNRKVITQTYQEPNIVFAHHLHLCVGQPSKLPLTPIYEEHN